LIATEDPTDAFDYETETFRVAHKRCNECLYTKNKIVGDARKEGLLEGCRTSGKYFICHKATLQGRGVVCRGFFDEENNAACQVAQRLGLVEFVDLSKNP
jgi:hypothetical protein